jgi:type II secretory pathway pseudopilin PulG
MVIGIAVIGLVTAAVAAWFVRISQKPTQTDEAADTGMLLAEIRALRTEIELLRQEQQINLPS